MAFFKLQRPSKTWKNKLKNSKLRLLIKTSEIFLSWWIVYLQLLNMWLFWFWLSLSFFKIKITCSSKENFCQNEMHCSLLPDTQWIKWKESKTIYQWPIFLLQTGILSKAISQFSFHWVEKCVLPFYVFSKILIYVRTGSLILE